MSVNYVDLIYSQLSLRPHAACHGPLCRLYSAGEFVLPQAVSPVKVCLSVYIYQFCFQYGKFQV